eukprot:gene6385-12913_t
MDSSAVPDDITCADQVFDIAFHPLTPIVASALITGAIEIHKYGTDIEDQLLLTLSHHASSCRGLQFSDDGLQLYSISSDKSINCVNQAGQSVLCYKDAHSVPINKLLCISPTQIATGDDSGCLKIWDTRLSQHVIEYDLHEDFISGMTYVEEYNTLLSVGGDATLCAYDLRKKDSSSRSDDQEAELHCVECIKGGKKVICGTQEGVIIVFSWGKWGDCSDRFPGHPNTVDSMLKVDESTIISGSGDGLIRVVQIQPNKMLGIIGDHDSFPVEGMRRTVDGNLLSSFSHDEVVRFWDVSMLNEDDDDDNENNNNETNMDMDGVGESKGDNENEDENDGEEDEDENENEDENRKNRWEDVMDEDDSEGDKDEDSDDSDDNEGGGGGGTKQFQPRFHLPSANEKFFSDL